MGIEAGLDMINQMKDIEAILIDDDSHIYTSDHIHFSNQYT
jgi:thiamine biosynthesis lipoprotein